MKHPCLGEEAVPGILDLDRFLELARPLDSKFYAAGDAFSPVRVVAIENPVRDLPVHPEYQELVRDGRLDVLFAVQACNHRRYVCEDCATGHADRAERLRAALADYGYAPVRSDETRSTLVRRAGDLEVAVTVLSDVRPVHYETAFWELFPAADLVLTNRVPVLSDHFWRVWAPRYQILVAPDAEEHAWGRILPQLDFGLRNFDAVALDVDRSPRERLLEFVESIVQASREPRRGGAPWRSLLAGLEEPVDGRAAGPAVAHFVRANRFDPSRETQPVLDFATRPDPAAYVSLLNAPRRDDQVPVDDRAAYLYLTLRLADECPDLETLRERLMKIGREQIADPWVKDAYFFGRDASPRCVLASERLPIHDIRFARGSYLELYFGKAGVPKAAWLAGTTAIGPLQFKAYYQDNGGVVRFHRKSGHVLQGHLAESADVDGLPLLGGKGTAMVRFHEDGTLESAQLREDARVPVGGANLLLRGGWRGPHQVRFHPNGDLESAYLAEVATIGGLPIDSVPAAADGERIPASAHKRVYFHAGGALKSGVLARAFEIEGTTYPAGTRIVRSADGRLLGPIFQTVGEGEYYWDALFPAGSLCQVDPSTSDPSWIRLAGELRLRSHVFPAGTEIAFGEEGGFRSVVAPASGRPRIALHDHAISVPEGATLSFEEWSGEPSGLEFSGAISIGGLTFVPPAERDPFESALSFHGNGRVARAVLGAAATVEEPHYGAIPLAGGAPVAFDEDGKVRAGTLGEDFTFAYRILDRSERPESGEMRPVRLPAGTVFSLEYQAKLDRAELRAGWSAEGLALGAGGVLEFDDAARISRVRFPVSGGRIGAYEVPDGDVTFHAAGVPASIVLARSARIGSLEVPSGARVEFHPTGGVATIESREAIEAGGRRFTREVVFGEDGKVRRGYLLEDETWHGVRIAGLERCRRLRFESPQERGGSSAVTFYPDGVSILRAVAAETFEREGRTIRAGQPVEFDEEGRLFLE